MPTRPQQAAKPTFILNRNCGRKRAKPKLTLRILIITYIIWQKDPHWLLHRLLIRARSAVMPRRYFRGLFRRLAEEMEVGAAARVKRGPGKRWSGS